MNSIQIYSDDDIPEFRHELWIRNGKKYPDDPSQVPPELEAHIDITTRIPLDYETALLPNEDLSVRDFIRLNLPQQEKNLVAAHAHLMFKSDPPNLQASVLHGRDIPHREFVKEAVQSVGQAILDGALAVLDGRYAGGRLPLWTITYWRRMDIILETKMIWKQAEDWLLCQHVGAAIQTTAAHLRTLPWSERTDIPGAYSRTRTMDFAMLLSDGMISTGVVDLMVHWISEKARASDEVRGRYVVVGLKFWTELDKAHNHGYFTSSPIPRFLERLEKKLRTGEKTLLFSVFLSKHKHFIAMEVDFMKAAIACGDSLHHRDSIVPTTVIRKIQWWTEVRMGGKFQWKGDTMAHVAPFIDSSILQAAFMKPVTIPHDMGDLLNPSTAGDLAEVYSKVQDSKSVSDDGHMQNNEEMGYDTEDFNENQFGVDVPWPSDTEACTVSRAASTISSDTDMMDLSAAPSPKSRVEGIRAKSDSAGVYSIFAETRQRAEVAARRKFFVDLVKTMVLKKDKKLCGVGMQGFKYAPDVLEFAHIISVHSPRAYQSIRELLQLPDIRTLQRHRARQGGLPIGITERTFELVVEFLTKLEWKGPVGLMSDDTKLMAALRPYRDVDGKLYILGGTGEPMLLVDPDALISALRSGTIKKGTKVRVVCLQVPMPNIPTLVVAALAITDDMSADNLLPYLQSILNGLLRHQIQVISFRSYIIHHPEDHRRNIDLRIPCFGTQQQPIAMVQDPPHLRKTVRSNSYSGARLLTLGNYSVLYSHFRDIAAADNGTLYNRDVEKVDRQDDNAATRLFSAHTLDWLTENHLDWIGSIIYLFIFGELVDAYENRHIKLIERVHLILRTLFFFMEAWEDFLDRAKYPKSRHFLSHEACDIIRFATRALLQLVIIYRDHLDGVYPLLPWLLSTAVCEHVFGICRQIIKDFTMQDFHHMVPKLYVHLREHFFFSHSSDGKARASGYNHTYTDSRKIDLAALAMYPTDAEIQRAATAAYEEAHGLWEILGVEGLRNQTAVVLRLPSIQSWFINPLVGSDEKVVDTPVSDVESEVGDEDEEPGTRQGIQEAMEWLEDEVTLPHEDDQLNSLAYAAISLSVQDSMHIRGLPECQLDTYQSDAAMLGQILAGCLSPINDPNERAHPATHQMEPASLNFKTLVELRMEHQTVQADKGVRSKGKGKEQSAGESERQALLRQYTEILHDREERGITTGNARSTRWTRHPTRGGRDGQVDGQVADAPAPGNEANAAEVAGTNANETQNRRAKIFRKHRLPAFVEAANIAPESPLLQAGNGLETASKNGSSYGFVFYSDSIWLAQVLSVYSKSAGKNGKHSWVSDSSKITAVSYIAAQLFQPVAPRQFTSIPRDNMGLKVSRFALLKPTSFLVVLKAVPTPAGQNFIISAQDHQYYAALQKKLASIREAMKEINGRRRMVPAGGSGEESN
ncbi:hypothetical protein EW146_g3772 [Bondarzewia mesenterica]|uniref:THAP9-like helix-turn-helix domain-containing protein n=1 Tax=Bondarzewia mesenterica TaxID=1095465 RepID=A0A4S4LWI7_9AGAM|nr:hypothetical protein EW146_g3772 [Bondarzewia mesenterica]